MRAMRSSTLIRRPKTSVVLRLRLVRKDLSDCTRRPLVSAARYSSMASGPLQDLIRLTPRSFTLSRYSKERYASVTPPVNGYRASSISPAPWARAMELLVVPKSIPIAWVLMWKRRAGRDAGMILSYIGRHSCRRRRGADTPMPHSFPTCTHLHNWWGGRPRPGPEGTPGPLAGL